MRYSSANRVAQQFADLANYEFTGTDFDQPNLKPMVTQSGPLIYVPDLSDGHMYWPPVWAVVLGPLALAYDSFGRLRVLRASKVAEFLYEV